MTLLSALSLFFAMSVLAAIPSTSVLAVTARAVSGGFLHGAMTAFGVVVGDVIYIAIAILGLSAIMGALGDFAFLLRYLGGGYLLFLGFVLWCSADVKGDTAVSASVETPMASFFLGLFITLGDQKAILFYLGFFPAFLDLSALSLRDMILVVLIALVSVGGVKLLYAFCGARLGRLLGASFTRLLNRGAAVIVVLVGLALIVVS